MALLLSNQNLAACLTFVAFAIIDVLDGAAARRGVVDNAARRTSDVLIDRVFVHLAALSCLALYDRGAVFIGAFIARDLAQACFSGYILGRYRAVVIGARWHMSYGIAMLAWGCWFIMFGDISATLSVATLAVALATLLDYIVRSLRLMPRTRDDS